MNEGFTLWFTGMSGAGKSTVSGLLAARLRETGAKVELLDGDVVRTHLCRGLGFSREDREENIRRLGFLCELLSRNGVIAIVAAISPYRQGRDAAIALRYAHELQDRRQSMPRCPCRARSDGTRAGPHPEPFVLRRR